MREADDAARFQRYIEQNGKIIATYLMDTKVRKPLRAARLTPTRTPEERRRLANEAIEAMNALAREARRNGLTPRKVNAILREIRQERRVKRRAR